MRTAKPESDNRGWVYLSLGIRRPNILRLRLPPPWTQTLSLSRSISAVMTSGKIPQSIRRYSLPCENFATGSPNSQRQHILDCQLDRRVSWEIWCQSGIIIINRAKSFYKRNPCPFFVLFHLLPWTVTMPLPTRRNGLVLASLLVRAATASPYFRTTASKLGNGGTKGSPEFWYHLSISVVLVLVGGLFAGWVVIYMSFMILSETYFHSVWHLHLWDLMNSISGCWPAHRKIQKKRRTRRKVYSSFSKLPLTLSDLMFVIT